MSQLRMRRASPILEYFPDESSNTIINGRFWSVACITIHLPASLMKPVFCTLISHALLAVSAFVLWYVNVLWPVNTLCSRSVENARISGYRYAARTILARSRALETLRLVKPVESEK